MYAVAEAADETQLLPRFCVWGVVLHGIGESTYRLSNWITSGKQKLA